MRWLHYLSKCVLNCFFPPGCVACVQWQSGVLVSFWYHHNSQWYSMSCCCEVSIAVLSGLPLLIGPTICWSHTGWKKYSIIKEIFGFVSARHTKKRCFLCSIINPRRRSYTAQALFYSHSRGQSDKVFIFSVEACRSCFSHFNPFLQNQNNTLFELLKIVWLSQPEACVMMDNNPLVHTSQVAYYNPE